MNSIPQIRYKAARKLLAKTFRLPPTISMPELPKLQMRALAWQPAQQNMVQGSRQAALTKHTNLNCKRIKFNSSGPKMPPRLRVMLGSKQPAIARLAPSLPACLVTCPAASKRQENNATKR